VREGSAKPDDYTSARKASKKRSSTALPEPVKRAKNSPKYPVTGNTRTSNTVTKVIASQLDDINAAESAVIEEPGMPSKVHNSSEQSVQRLSAWMYQQSLRPPPNMTSGQSSAHQSPWNNISAIQDVNPLIAHAATEIFPAYRCVLDSKGSSFKSAILQPIVICQRVPQHQIGPNQIPCARSQVLKMIPEETFQSPDVLSQCERESPFEVTQHPLPVAIQNRSELTTHGSLEMPVGPTNSLPEVDDFNDLSDDDLIALDLALPFNIPVPSLQCDSREQNSSLQGVATASPKPRLSDLLLPFPTVSDNDQYDFQYDRTNEEGIDFFGLTSRALDTITFTAPSTALPSKSLMELSLLTPHPVSYITAADQGSLSTKSSGNYVHSTLHPPIVRPSFPHPIRDRSPLKGVSATTCLRTCFRIGEALNVGCTAARNDSHNVSSSILIELYAKVVSANRDETGNKQHFVFADLFHEARPPFIKGICDCWKGSELWNYDCGQFLAIDGNEEKKTSRVIGRMKREGTEWRFVVLNIWEATWEDVEYVRGIVGFW
jgi:hypothetical protein